MASDIQYDGSDLEALAGLDNYYGWIVDTFRPWLRGHALEIGAGAGTVSHRLLPCVERLDVVEPSPNLIDRLRERFAGEPRVTLFAETLEHRLSQTADAVYDAVVMVNVLEHIEDDAAALSESARILKPGGRLLVFVPALRFLFSAFDRTVGHFRRYHLGELRDRVGAAGFDVEFSRYFDILGVFPWWVLQTIGGRTDLNPTATRLYDRFGVPLTRAVESLVAPPFGKNIVLVARRAAPGDAA